MLPTYVSPSLFRPKVSGLLCQTAKSKRPRLTLIIVCLWCSASAFGPDRCACSGGSAVQRASRPSRCQRHAGARGDDVEVEFAFQFARTDRAAGVFGGEADDDVAQLPRVSGEGVVAPQFFR